MMDEDLKVQDVEETISEEKELIARRRFLLGLRKWSMVVIGGALFGGGQLIPDREVEAAAWANRAGGGGAWANRAGGGGAWANRGAAWANRGGAWINRF